MIMMPMLKLGIPPVSQIDPGSSFSDSSAANSALVNSSSFKSLQLTISGKDDRILTLRIAVSHVNASTQFSWCHLRW